MTALGHEERPPAKPGTSAHPGWLNERAFAFITAPVKENLQFEVLAWTASTKGTATGSTVQSTHAARSGDPAQ